MLQTVAIVGRPNVGKSTLFNRILKKRIAVIDEVPGVTRDRNYATTDWIGRNFFLVDTGGMVPQTDDLMEQMIYEQAEFAIDEADVVLLMVDTQVGIDSVDLMIARMLQRAGKKTLVVANKVDNEDIAPDVFEFVKLGLGEPIPVSSTIGLGIGELLDALVEALPDQASDVEQDSGLIRLAVVGRPNVGKSSFINKLLGENRLIVTPIAGTTRDSVDTPFHYDGDDFMLVDTAGLRRKFKVQENIEFYTNLRTDRAVATADIVVLLIDAARGLSTQDQKILDSVFAKRRSAVLAINKWDLIEKDSFTADKYSLEIADLLAKYAHIPAVFISALSGQRVTKVLELTKIVYNESRKKIPTPELNDFLQQIIGRNHPPARRGKHIKINYMTQTEIGPPTFLFFANYPILIDKSYISYIENQIRHKYGFKGVPFRLKFRKK